MREGNGNLFSTLLGLKEWVWSTGERMNDGKKKEPHKHLEDNYEEYFCMFSFKSNQNKREQNQSNELVMMMKIRGPTF